MRSSKTIMIMAVVLMMFVGAIPLTDNSGSDAAVGDGGTFSYTINYDSSLMSTTSKAISVEGMDSVNAPQLNDGVPTGYGSWTWSTTTGRGPFNSFYAAFDATNGNSFVSVLNPYDLSETITGEPLGSGSYNIMWVLPKTYWYTTNNGQSLTLTNTNSNNAGVAYAHTINGHEYDYVAYGVYEGSISTIGGDSVLMSQTNVAPNTTGSRSQYRTWAHNYEMSETLTTDPTDKPAYSMLWNYYQWALYRYCVLTLIEDFNAQTIIGNGPVYRTSGANIPVTGLMDQLGPYSGTRGSITSDPETYGQNSVKMFIENAWGGAMEYVDDVLYSGTSNMYIGQHGPMFTDTEIKNGLSTTISVLQENYYPTSISTTSETWGYPGNAKGGSSTTGLTDITYSSDTSDRIMIVGGMAATYGPRAPEYGLSFINMGYAANSSDGNPRDSRLVIVFDSAAFTTPLSVNATGSGTLSNGIVSGQTSVSVANVPVGTTMSINDNILIIDSTTITATPTANTAQFTNTFDGFYYGDVKLQTGETVTSGMSITARFTSTVNNYNVTIQSSNTNYGTVSIVGDISNTPYGSVIRLSGTDNNILSLNGSVVTATAADPTTYYTYEFDGYHRQGQLVQDGDIITGATTITANFSAVNIYTILIVPNEQGWGSVDVSQIIGVPTGSEFTVDGNEIEIYSVRSTASATANSAQYSYGFINFTIGPTVVQTGTAISDNTTVTANFSRTVNTYAVSVSSNDQTWGAVSASGFPNEDYGSVITIGSDTITINGDTITATVVAEDDAQYSYGFDGFYNGDLKLQTGAIVTGTMTITARFTQTVNTYTITWLLYDSIQSTTTVPYGSVPEYTGTPQREGYAFSAWDPEPVAVTGPTTYTATWVELPHITVTFDATGGTIYGPGTKKVYISQTYGELPDARKSNHRFIGWYTAEDGGERITPTTIVEATEDQTLYAQWGASSEYKSIRTIIDTIPIIAAAALLLMIIGSALYNRR